MDMRPMFVRYFQNQSTVFAFPYIGSNGYETNVCPLFFFFNNARASYTSSCDNLGDTGSVCHV
jgi:hypothetical protein